MQRPLRGLRLATVRERLIVQRVEFFVELLALGLLPGDHCSVISSRADTGDTNAGGVDKRLRTDSVRVGLVPDVIRDQGGVVTDVTNGGRGGLGGLIGFHLALAHGSSYLHGYMEDYPGVRSFTRVSIVVGASICHRVRR